VPWRAEVPGERPTLGPHVLDWIAHNLIVPDGPQAGEALVLTPEQQRFVMKLYELDPRGGEHAIIDGALRNSRVVRRAVLSRPKGWGKSPLLAALCIAEALADVVPDGWNADGRPVGRPWTSLGFKAKTQVVAVSEDQTTNTWDPLLEMCREGPVARNYRVEPLETFVSVPRGRIEFTTSAARSREGFRPVFSALDQTESWVPSIGGPRLAATIRRNLTKTGGSSVESPNAFIPGEESVAEKSWEAWQLQKDGKLKTGGIYFDHREAPPETDPTERTSLLAGLAYAYGDSVWVDLNRVVGDYWDPNTDPQDGRRFYLNQITHAADQWIAQPEWTGRADVTKVVADRETITLGFDGSRKRARGVTDATALIACRVSDGHVFEPLGHCVWEQPDGPAGQDWRVPVPEVAAAVHACFDRYNVVGFYADPALWESYVAAWEAKYNDRLKVKATREHPCQFWMTGGRSGLVVRALEQFHSAVIDAEMTHDGSYALTRHVLNARRRPGRSGLQIAKPHPDSPQKIDAAVAAVLAWQARLAAIAAGVGQETASFVPRRIR
jgi:hypothetical protein